MHIENHILFIDNNAVELPHLPRPAVVKVWRVPTEYRANGLFISVTPYGEPEEVPACDLRSCVLVGELHLPEHEDAVLEAMKEDRIRAVKQQAAAMIKALDWRLERAQERDSLGLQGAETPEDVMLEREAIRRASNRCEAAIAAALAPQEVMEAKLEVREEDKPKRARISRHEFLSRFTEEESAAIVAAAEANAVLKMLLMRLQTVQSVLLTDPVTQAAVSALEAMGIIREGRAGEVLALP